MKKLSIAFAAGLLLVLLAGSGYAQRKTSRKPAPKKPAPATRIVPPLDVRTAREKVEIQADNLDRFVAVLGPIAQSIEENLGREGIKPLSIEGYSHGQWVVMDYDDVIVHIFYEPVREFYDLERLWSKATRVALPEPYESQARDLRLAGQAR